MKSRKFKQLLSLFTFLMVFSTFTSCNRGYGCPSNFSMNETVVQIVKVVVQAVVKI
ncbi:MAG: hypothetical protein R2828_31530 [Saprospiraceae bacterium]